MASTALRLRRALSLSSAISTRSPTTSTFHRSPISRFPFATPSPTTTTSNPKIGSRSIHTTSLSLSASRSFNQGNTDQIDENTILFEGCDYKHWLITMDFPKDPLPSPEEMVETYVQTLAKVVGSVEEAKKRMYACSTTTYHGFQAEMDEETSKKFEDLPGVVFVLPDSYIDPVNKEYGGDKYINGTIIPRPPPVQYGRQRRPRDQQNYPPRDNHGPGQNYPPRDNHGPMQNYQPRDNHGPAQNFIPRDNHGPAQNYPPRDNHGPAQNYPPRDNHGPAQNYPPRDNHGPAQNYPPRDNHGPAQNYPPRDNHGPAQNYPPRDNHGPVQNYPPRDNHGPAQNYPPRDNHSPAQNYPPRDNRGPAQNYPPQQNYAPRQNYPPQQSYAPPQQNFAAPRQGERMDPPPQSNQGSYNQGSGYPMRNQSNQNLTPPSPSGGAQYGQGGRGSYGQNQTGFEYGNGSSGEGANSTFGQGFAENGENRQFNHPQGQQNVAGQKPPSNYPPMGQTGRD